MSLYTLVCNHPDGNCSCNTNRFVTASCIRVTKLFTDKHANIRQSTTPRVDDSRWQVGGKKVFNVKLQVD